MNFRIAQDTGQIEFDSSIPKDLGYCMECNGPATEDCNEH